MKILTIPLFAILCLFVLTGVAHATEIPEPASAEIPVLDLSAAVATPAAGCDQAPTVALGGQETTSTFSNGCGTCSYVQACKGVPIGNPCWTGSNWGNCDLYLGIQCSDGSGWDCTCYGPGGGIP